MNEIQKTTNLSNLTSTVKELSNSLSALQPLSDSNTTQLITYALVATAVVGIFVYHYIREQEKLD